MRRSQLMLSEKHHRFLGDEAKRVDRSMSALLREWIEQRMQARWDRPIDRDSLWELVGMGRGGPGRAGEMHDRVLAEARRKRMPPPRRRIK